MVETFDFNNVAEAGAGSTTGGGDPGGLGPALHADLREPHDAGGDPRLLCSATGITTTLAPTKSLYLNYGVYDAWPGQSSPA